MRLSILIPTYNRAQMLGRTIAGLLDQSAPTEDYEIVVVDDGSTDDTTEVMAGLSRPGVALQYIRQDNKGRGAARNTGLRAAQGKIALFMGDDCIPDRRLVEEHLRAHDKEGDVAVVGHVSWHPELPVTPLMRFLDEGTQFGFARIKDPDHVSYWFFYTSNCSLQRHWIEDVGGFDEDFVQYGFEDNEVAYRMQRRGLRIIYRPAAHCYHHHATALEQFLVRQWLCGKAAVSFWRKHPELKEQLGIVEAGRATTVIQLFEATMGYAQALGVKEELRGESPLAQADLERLWSNAEMAEAGRAWAVEAFGPIGPEKVELIRLRGKVYLMAQQWQRVSARRFYRWSEWLARQGWGLLRCLGFGRRARTG